MTQNLWLRTIRFLGGKRELYKLRQKPDCCQKTGTDPCVRSSLQTMGDVVRILPGFSIGKILVY